MSVCRVSAVAVRGRWTPAAVSCAAAPQLRSGKSGAGVMSARATPILPEKAGCAKGVPMSQTSLPPRSGRHERKATVYQQGGADTLPVCGVAQIRHLLRHLFRHDQCACRNRSRRFFAPPRFCVENCACSIRRPRIRAPPRSPEYPAGRVPTPCSDRAFATRLLRRSRRAGCGGGAWAAQLPINTMRPGCPAWRRHCAPACAT